MEEEEEFRRSVHLGRMEAVMVARYTRQTRNTSSSSPADCLYLTGGIGLKSLLNGQMTCWLDGSALNSYVLFGWRLTLAAVSMDGGPGGGDQEGGGDGEEGQHGDHHRHQAVVQIRPEGGVVGGALHRGVVQPHRPEGGEVTSLF